MVPPPCADDDAAGLERELSVLLRRARAWSGELARTVHPDLEAAAYGLLTHVVDGGARATDLAEYFGIHKATVSRQVRLLEQLGLLRREPDHADARVLHLVATDEGVRRRRPPHAAPAGGDPAAGLGRRRCRSARAAAGPLQRCRRT